MVQHPEEALERMPPLLRDHIGSWPACEHYPETMKSILPQDDSIVFMLDLRYPHPTLTPTIVWRLQPKEYFEVNYQPVNP